MSATQHFMVLPIDLLAARGVLMGSESSAAAGGSEWCLTVNGTAVLIAFDRSAECLQLRFQDDTSGISQILVERARSGRRQFICEWCLRHCRHVVHEILFTGCRSCYQQMPSRESKSLRSSRFNFILNDLKAGNFRLRRIYAKATLKPVIRSANDTQASRPDLSTKQAVLLGRGAADYDVVRYIKPQMDDLYNELNPAERYTRPHSVALINEAPELDIRVLAPAMLKRDKFTARTLCWGDRSQSHLEVLFAADWRGPEPRLIAARDFNDAEPSWQALPLFCQANGRLRFSCPHEKVHYDVLYFRGGVFASRRAARLVHPSQRVRRSAAT